MAQVTYVKQQRLWLKDHPTLDEHWLQARIAEDPALLGLGPLELKDRERAQPGAGRLDLLLRDPDGTRRYEVEVQLGRTDEAHIIRTIEYWDFERKRYPQYEHAAVLIAEDVTSRFLNVISLFNGTIPLIAIQLTAFMVRDEVSLVFTKVLDLMTLGLVDEDEDSFEVTDRAYWEAKATTKSVKMADVLFEDLRAFAPSLKLKYNKFYIGLADDGRAANFVLFRPRKNGLRLEIRLPSEEGIEKELEAAGIDLMDYDHRWSRYRLRITESDLQQNRELIARYMQSAYSAHRGE